MGRQFAASASVNPGISTFHCRWPRILSFGEDLLPANRRPPNSVDLLPWLPKPSLEPGCGVPAAAPVQRNPL